MPDENKGANSGASPTPTPEPVALTPEPGAPTPTKVPFHEMMKDPDFQEFYQRQMQKAVADQVAQVVNQFPQVPKKNDEDDEVPYIVETFKVDKDQAKALVDWRDRGVKKSIKPLEDKMDAFDLSVRFGQLFKQNPEANQYDKKMIEIFNGMNEVERNFVLRSPLGPTSLYDEARRRSGGYAPPPPASAPAPRSAPAAAKTGDKDTLVGKALEALRNGDRASYENIMADLQRK